MTSTQENGLEPGKLEPLVKQTNKPLGEIIALVFRRLPATSMSRAMLCMRGAVDISCLPAHNIV
jgi:hypothetical protein